jgi:cytochrome c peroxidase
MKRFISILFIYLCGANTIFGASPLGLPPVPVPANNPQTAEKIQLGDKLFNDKRFSTTGEVACATCHDPKKGFVDQLRVSEGIHKLTGTRNAPTVINAAYLKTQFWDGREPSLESQSAQPFLNPVEMGLANHEPILKIVRSDPEYVQAFRKAFGVSAVVINMEHVKQAIAAFERMVIAGDSPFDRYQFGGDKIAMTPQQIRGLQVFTEQGRCVSCHVIEQTQALFTDNRFHNLGVGFKRIRNQVNATAAEFLKAKHAGADVDHAVLTKRNVSELGRFAITENLSEVGAFKTATLRNIAVTAPYMHDGSLNTLKEVVDFYNNGGRVKETDPVDNFQSGGIRPLNLSDQQKADLVEFMKALTSPAYAQLAKSLQN